MSVRRIVEVTWFDAQSSMHSMTIDDLKEMKPVMTKSIGYLLIEAKEYIILGYMDFGEGLIKHHTCIPKGMINKIKVIREGKR